MPLREVESDTIAIYALMASDGVVRYVGKSASPLGRFADHCRGKVSHKSPVTRWINEGIARADSLTMQILEWANAETWQEVERKWVAHYRSRQSSDAPLLNIEPGGLSIKYAANSGPPRFYGYLWVMRFCSRTKNADLRDFIKGIAQNAKAKGEMWAFDRHLRRIILDERPNTRFWT